MLFLGQHQTRVVEVMEFSPERCWLRGRLVFRRLSPADPEPTLKQAAQRSLESHSVSVYFVGEEGRLLALRESWEGLRRPDWAPLFPMSPELVKELRS